MNNYSTLKLIRSNYYFAPKPSFFNLELCKISRDILSSFILITKFILSDFVSFIFQRLRFWCMVSIPFIVFYAVGTILQSNLVYISKVALIVCGYIMISFIGRYICDDRLMFYLPISIYLATKVSISSSEIMKICKGKSFHLRLKFIIKLQSMQNDLFRQLLKNLGYRSNYEACALFASKNCSKKVWKFFFSEGATKLHKFFQNVNSIITYQVLVAGNSCYSTCFYHKTNQ